MMKMINRLRRNSKGATAIEYGLLAALIACGIIGSASALGTKVSDTFTTVKNGLAQTVPPAGG